MNLTGKLIRLILKVDDVTHLDRLEFLIGTSTFTNYFRWTVHTHSAVNATRTPTRTDTSPRPRELLGVVRPGAESF
ncbi:hypothetical protein AQJ27_30600 [Streptomyces olivochromogenes]|nr:hypothetical protein AQJ27_30600 [Streptomyces olivochromogenes]